MKLPDTPAADAASWHFASAPFEPPRLAEKEECVMKTCLPGSEPLGSGVVVLEDEEEEEEEEELWLHPLEWELPLLPR